MNPTLSEFELVELLQRGERIALEYLYDHYSAALFGIILRICKDNSTAEDLLQESFTKIWLSRTAYDSSKGTVFTWMLTIARRTAIDTIRSKDFRDRTLNRSIEDFVDTDEIGSTQNVNPDTSDLRALVAVLPADQKQVIDLMYFQGYSQSEIAELLATPVGTIKSRSRMALTKLRSFFSEHSQSKHDK